MQSQQLQQGMVLGHPQADGFALRMRHPARHFLGGFQNEGVGPRGAGFEQTVLAVVDFGVDAQLAQIAAQQGEVVPFVHSTDAAHLVHGGFVIQVAGQGITGVGGHGQHLALRQQGHRLLEETRLWVVGVNLQPLGHARLIECGLAAVPTRGSSRRATRAGHRGRCGFHPGCGNRCRAKRPSQTHAPCLRIPRLRLPSGCR